MTVAPVDRATSDVRQVIAPIYDGDVLSVISAIHNRYGFPGHLKPYSDAWEASGNNIEVNFMPDYRHLHEAGYHILAYDLRNFGQSAAGSGGAIGNGIREHRDVRNG
ncbi:hypothetical protein [Amycolatopsis pithecellobii]|uniref:Uncharacterized protein n=1 Tax=Amycolatopsis pithecellobii TaxID=664692 RepID=A0A6N7YHN9_9PSEU|nr:hypothetical protein [Amycolatopsis pithecellobii]MTD52407.1 hypothetical protein [Amycolatopsis pithecellobii]